MPQVWLVTGAGRGLGMAITQAALEAGHTVHNGHDEHNGSAFAIDSR
jgi:NAD(P)-dependent dehydrogenase (short-subunit alcohol dehydrogenase family)